jgi:uncharacterized membrane protein YbhN (UPF0104 family)
MRAVVDGALDALRSVSPWNVAAALALYVLSLAAVGLRWRRILTAMGHRVRFLDTLLANTAGIFINNVTPASRLGGEACRIAAIGLRSGVPVTAATVSSVYDRLSEVLPVGAVVLCSVPALVSVGARLGRPVLAVAIALGIAVVGAVAYRRLLHNRAWWKSWRGRIAPGALDRRSVAAAVGYSGFVWAQDVARLMIVVAAFGERLSVPQAAMLSVVTIVGGLVPTIGGLGAIEGGLVAGLVLFGVRADTAAAMTAVERAISYVFATAAGASAFAIVGGRTLWNAMRSRS